MANLRFVNYEHDNFNESNLINQARIFLKNYQIIIKKIFFCQFEIKVFTKNYEKRNLKKKMKHSKTTSRN